MKIELFLNLACLVFLTDAVDPPKSMVAIQDNLGPICAGVFINKQYVATTATCILGKSHLKVVIESIAQQAANKMSDVKGVTLHPYYRAPHLDYNVAILKVKDIADAEVSKLSDEEPTAKETVRTTGWGSEAYEFKAEESVGYERKTCVTDLARNVTITGKLMCVDTKASKLSFVQGSPVVHKDNNKVYGIAVFEGTTAKTPSVYLNMANPEIFSFLDMFTAVE